MCTASRSRGRRASCSASTGTWHGPRRIRARMSSTSTARRWTIPCDPAGIASTGPGVRSNDGRSRTATRAVRSCCVTRSTSRIAARCAGSGASGSRCDGRRSTRIRSKPRSAPSSRRRWPRRWRRSCRGWRRTRGRRRTSSWPIARGTSASARPGCFRFAPQTARDFACGTAARARATGRATGRRRIIRSRSIRRRAFWRRPTSSRSIRKPVAGTSGPTGHRRGARCRSTSGCAPTARPPRTRCAVCRRIPPARAPTSSCRTSSTRPSGSPQTVGRRRR